MIKGKTQLTFLIALEQKFIVRGNSGFLIHKEGRKRCPNLHIAVDADTGGIKIRLVSPNDVSDAYALDEILSKIKEEIGRSQRKEIMLAG